MDEAAPGHDGESAPVLKRIIIRKDLPVYVGSKHYESVAAYFREHPELSLYMRERFLDALYMGRRWQTERCGYMRRRTS